MSTLKIGIISETLVQQHYLREAVDDCGYDSSIFFLMHQLIQSVDSVKVQQQGVAAWLIDIDSSRLAAHPQASVFETWLFNLDKPVIFGEGHTFNATDSGFVSWERQLKIKLLNLAGQFQLEDKSQRKAKHVWVLAASTGGPDAVKIFLDNIDADLDVSFIYAQHIDDRHSKTLGASVTRDSRFESRVATHGDILIPGLVTVMPTNCVAELQNNGTIIVRNDLDWRGDYNPSIDQVVANVSNVYGACAGVIFFTGLGDDGVTGSRLMSLNGGQVWVQSLESCASTAMPRAIIDAECATKIESPQTLAKSFQALLTEPVAVLASV